MTGNPNIAAKIQSFEICFLTKNLIQLYQALHPDDKTITKDDLDIVTLDDFDYVQKLSIFSFAGEVNGDGK